MPQRLPHASVWPIRSWTRNMIAHHGVSSVLSLWWSKSCSRIFKRSGGKIPRTDYWFISYHFDFNHISKFFCGSPHLSKWRWHFQPGGEGGQRNNLTWSYRSIKQIISNCFPANHGELQNVVKIPILLTMLSIGRNGFGWVWMWLDAWPVWELHAIGTMGYDHSRDDWLNFVSFSKLDKIKGQLGVPLTVYPWYLLCSLGILGDKL